MTNQTAKSFISPAIQAKLLLWRVALIGIARDFWKDAPMPWPAWAKAWVVKRRAVKVAQAEYDRQKKVADAKKAAAKARAPVQAPAAPVEAPAPPEPKSWTADRIQVMEAMWGEGMHLPGGTEYIDSLASSFAINHDMSVLDLVAGLGGLSRHLVEKYNCFVSGMEHDSATAARGMIMSIAAGKSKTASVVGYDPTTYTASRKYDAIFIREVFFRIIGKEKFFKAIDSSLKNGGGHIVFTDYILDVDKREKPAVMKWLARERGSVPVSMIETIKTWRGMGYDLRVTEDQTNLYKAYILKGIKELANYMILNIPDGPTKAVVVSEVDLWAKRLAALNDGLRYCRFYGIKY